MWMKDTNSNDHSFKGNVKNELTGKQQNGLILTAFHIEPSLMRAEVLNFC